MNLGNATEWCSVCSANTNMLRLRRAGECDERGLWPFLFFTSFSLNLSISLPNTFIFAHISFSPFSLSLFLYGNSLEPLITQSPVTTERIGISSTKACRDTFLQPKGALFLQTALGFFLFVWFFWGPSASLKLFENHHDFFFLCPS